MHRLHETRASVQHGECLGNYRRLHEDDRRRCHPRSDSPNDREDTDTGVVQPFWSSRVATLGSRRELRESRHQTPLRPLWHQEVANDAVPSPGQCSNGAIQLNTSRSTAEPEHLQHVVDAYNVTPHATTGYSPFYLMFRRHARLPVDMLFGEQEASEDEPWVTLHQRRLQEAYAVVNRRMKKAAAERKKIFDRKARDIEVYMRNHPPGRNKIQDAFRDRVYHVVRRHGEQNVYTVEPSDGFGNPRTVGRAELKICERPLLRETTSDLPEPPQRRHRQAPPPPRDARPRADSSSSSENGFIAVVESVDDDVDDVDNDAPPSPVRSPSSSLPTSDDDRPDEVVVRRSSRHTAGVHPNVHQLPRYARCDSIFW